MGTPSNLLSRRIRIVVTLALALAWPLSHLEGTVNAGVRFWDDLRRFGLDVATTAQKVFLPLEWRLLSTREEIRSAALEQLQRAGSSRAVQVLMKTFSRLDALYQFRAVPLLAKAGPDAKPALPVLHAALDKTLRTELLPHRFPSCGTPPIPEYADIELLNGAALIRTILVIDPNQREPLIWKLVDVFRSNNATMNYFAWRELKKLEAGSILKEEFAQRPDPAIKKALDGVSTFSASKTARGGSGL